MNSPRELVAERFSLLCRMHTLLCALPLEHVIETMRPLPVEVMSEAPHFVLGLAIIRGAPVPVINVARLLGIEGGNITRFITMRAGSRQVAFAVDGVVGVRRLSAESLQELPPLLQDIGADIISSVGTLDAELLVVLRDACVIPESLWERLGVDGTAS